MPVSRRCRTALWAALLMAFCLLSSAVTGGRARAQTVSAEDLISAVVQVKAFINPDGRTVGNLGRERDGTGVVIDAGGLVLTIGYLMVEAHSAEVVTHDGHTFSAEVVGYDHATGFGLLRAAGGLKVRPLPLGSAAEVKPGERVIIAGYGGADRLAAGEVVSRREFAGNWEYLLDSAIFTTPPYPAWSGAALINRAGRLVGIGSLIVGDTSGKGEGPPGNMFVPIDGLPPILADLIASGRVAGPGRPWIGLNTEEAGGSLRVARVTPGGPAERAGIAQGDVVSGIGGKPAKSLGELYRQMWALGNAGALVPLDIVRGGNTQRVDVKSIDRHEHLKLKSTF